MQGPCVASIGAAVLVAASPWDDGEGEDEDGERPEDALLLQQLLQDTCPSAADQFAMGPENMKQVWQPRARRVHATLLVTAVLGAALAAAGESTPSTPSTPSTHE